MKRGKGCKHNEKRHLLKFVGRHVGELRDSIDGCAFFTRLPRSNRLRKMPGIILLVKKSNNLSKKNVKM